MTKAATLLFALLATASLAEAQQNQLRGLSVSLDIEDLAGKQDEINDLFNITLTPTTISPDLDTCEPQGIPPFIEEDYIAFKYEGEFPFENITEIIFIDEAFVIAYEDLINCTQDGAFRGIFDAEFIAFQPEDEAFLLRAGVFCNSCPMFSGAFDDCGVELFTVTNGTNATADETCNCDGPDVEEFVILMNEYLEFANISITIIDVEQLCPIPDCIPDPANVTSFNASGVCLANLTSLTSTPSEFPSEFPTVEDSPAPTISPEPSEVPSASPTEETPAPTEETPAPTEETPAPTEQTPAPTERTPTPTVAPTEEDEDTGIDPTASPIEEDEDPARREGNDNDTDEVETRMNDAPPRE